MKINLKQIFTYPYDNSLILQKQKSIRRELLDRDGINYTEKRIAILGGSTIEVIENILEIFLLYSYIRPVFYKSEYNKYYEDAVFTNEELDDFKPEIIIIFTSMINIIEKPDLYDSNENINRKITAEYGRFKQIWTSLTEKYNAIIIQNNMELPYSDSFGNLGMIEPYGITSFIERINTKFAEFARNHKGMYINDIHSLSACIGLRKWHNRFQYYAYKFAMDYDVMPDVANNLAKIIRAVFGKNKKCLVLDLDNTLWGGVIGDDGLENIQIGHETPDAEAYTEFQNYVLKLKKRGVILAVCSKNEEDIAKSGFEHPDSILHVDDFVSFYANWNPKNINIKAISEELNIGIDSLVFIDDNPVERQLIRDTLPEVSVPEIDPLNVFSYIRAIEEAGYFEPIVISEDDYKRNSTYVQNKQRHDMEKSMGSYDDFLKSLNMSAEIDSFQPIYFDRISQLTNKSNQFNLTTRRYTRIDIEKMAIDNDRYITLYGRLMDKLGDNGLVSVVIGEKKENEIHILLWLMSCRVLKRGMEDLMLDALVDKAIKAGCNKIIGYYFKTKKNKMVSELYKKFGFTKISYNGDDTIWELSLKNYQKHSKFIIVKGFYK